jgi:[ribosomal protein S5]-alanine N-acetyltransferase
MMTLPILKTERLLLKPMQPGMELAMIDCMQANEAHFRPWNSPPAPGEYSLERWTTLCAQSAQDFEMGRGYRFVLLRREAPDQPVGLANYSQVSRGPFQACFLGYQIARDCEGQGLMREALVTGNRFVFETVRLHRIHANYIPANIRSGRLLARLGFTIEGYAKEYLFINGAWQDHVLTSLTNRSFDPGWLQQK